MMWLPHPIPRWAKGWCWGLARTFHLCLHSATTLPLLCSILPLPPLRVPQSPARRNGLSPQGGFLRRGRGDSGVGSTHSPSQAMWAPVRVWERTEWLCDANTPLLLLLPGCLSHLSHPCLFPTATHVSRREAQFPDPTPQVCVTWFLNDWLG